MIPMLKDSSFLALAVQIILLCYFLGDHGDCTSNNKSSKNKNSRWLMVTDAKILMVRKERTTQRVIFRNEFAATNQDKWTRRLKRNNAVAARTTTTAFFNRNYIIGIRGGGSHSGSNSIRVGEIGDDVDGDVSNSSSYVNSNNHYHRHRHNYIRNHSLITLVRTIDPPAIFAEVEALIRDKLFPILDNSKQRFVCGLNDHRRRLKERKKQKEKMQLQRKKEREVAARRQQKRSIKKKTWKEEEEVMIMSSRTKQQQRLIHHHREEYLYHHHHHFYRIHHHHHPLFFVNHSS